MSGYVPRHVSVFLRVFLLVVPGRVDGELGDYFPAGLVDDQDVGSVGKSDDCLALVGSPDS